MKFVILGFALCGNLLASDLQPPPPLSSIHGKGEHYIALKGFNHKWVAAEKGGGIYLTSTRGHVSVWETFRIFCHTENCSEVSLKVSNNQWVCAEPSGALMANRGAIGPWEQFTLEKHPHNEYAFKTAHGSYITVDLNQNIHNRLKTGPLSKEALFKIKTLSAGFHHRDEL